ncbi:hypothetical protein Hanom_Chr06g00521541 [Helianthus anomalus]
MLNVRYNAVKQRIGDERSSNTNNTLGTRITILNVCQHKWRELKSKLDQFKICLDRVPVGDLTHDDRVEIAKIEWRHDGNSEFKWVPQFNFYRTLFFLNLVTTFFFKRFFKFFRMLCNFFLKLI